MKDSEKEMPLPSSIYVDQDESGNPRIVAHTAPTKAIDPMARHLQRQLEAL